MVAVAQNGVIGKDGKMPWHSKEELQYFKKTTSQYPVLMGRKTLESMGKPLKNRLNLILSKKPEMLRNYEDIIIFDNIDEAFKYCENNNYEKLFVLGGEEIYRQTMDDCDTMLISWMKFEVEGDTFFPEIDENVWEVESITNYNDFDVYRYKKRS
jgi:dihydrofolate reductase